MAGDTPLIRSLRAAVQASPSDVPLRLHLAELLLEAGNPGDAASHAAIALQQVPNSAHARGLMTRANARLSRQSGPPVPAAPRGGMTSDEPTERHSFNWAAAEFQFADIQQPFVDGGTAPLGAPILFEVETASTRLSDVSGMTEVKQRLTATFLAPMRNPDLRRMYGKNLRGGLLLYGPPGCGKTFVARSVAGELGAKFLAVSLSDLLDVWAGAADRNLHEVFEAARRAAPCLLFLDELDALGRKRGQTWGGGTHEGTINQLLAELDAVAHGNEGVYVLAAASNPWDVAAALRRGGRFERMLLVPPPDQQARQAVLQARLRDWPTTGLNVRDLAKRTDEFSAADLGKLCELAAERALADSARTGKPRAVASRDFEAALAEARPTTGGWFSVARNAVMYAGSDTGYEELRRHLKRRRLL